MRTSPIWSTSRRTASRPGCRSWPRLGPEPMPATWVRRCRWRDDGMIALDPALAVPALYAGCDQADIDESIAHLGLQPAVTFQQEITAAGWETIPSTYVQCTEDRAVPYEIQRVMAARCASTVEFPTNHSPFLTMVSELADVVERAAQAGGS
ncbi:MAG: alpha/beta fold hydrolase [Ilumatobacteraceae bacterium]